VIIIKRILVPVSLLVLLIGINLFGNENTQYETIDYDIKLKLSGRDFDWPDWQMLQGERDITDLLNMATTAPTPDPHQECYQGCQHVNTWYCPVSEQ
jgi:hypothetical protein